VGQISFERARVAVSGPTLSRMASNQGQEAETRDDARHGNSENSHVERSRKLDGPTASHER